ncbi:hypothetical protein R1flu_015066 [Riccia fluitans]|uniref:Uncharacterized protein n=1 Tax=Riccia fluitans TaxID=41844 RepID=A0ABD1YI76_9MARC
MELLWQNVRFFHYREATTAASVLASDHKAKGLQLVLRPLGSEGTFKRKGAGEIKVPGIEDKRQITCCVASTAGGTLLPFQLIFQDHRGQQFRDFLAQDHPYICLLHIPAGCTSIFQLADVGLQRPLKATFSQRYHQWAIAQVQRALADGFEPQGTKLDTSIQSLRAKCCEWMYDAWTRVAAGSNKILKAWEDCGLLDAWKAEKQLEAFSRNIHGELFKQKLREKIAQEVHPGGLQIKQMII